MSFYEKDDPTHLFESLKSLYNQTLPADEIILIQDGPVSQDLVDVVTLWKEKLPIKLEVVAENKGLAHALNLGLGLSSYDLVARMDADDVAHPERFNKQVSFLKQHPDITVVGSWISEFLNDPEKVESYRKLPQSPEELFQFAKRRCPLNHPSVMYRKEDVLAVGGYGHFRNQQDYHLWGKLLHKGYRLANIPEPLLFMRISPDLFHRRGGLKYFKMEYEIQKEFFENGFISRWEFYRNTVIRLTTRLLPNRLRTLFYGMFLR